MQRFPDRRIAALSDLEKDPRRVSAGFQSTEGLLHEDLLETLKEPEFKELVSLASQICSTPVSAISLVDERRQWITSLVGTELTETPRDVGFCAHVIASPNIFVVEEATKDPRFANNPLVTASGGIRFYAGIALNQPGSGPFGTLCVIDTKPRTISESQRQSLAILGRQVQTRFELRAKQKKLEAALADNERLAATLRETNELFMTFMNNAPLASYIKDADGRMVFYNRELAARFGVSTEKWLGLKDHEIWPKADADQFRRHDLQVLAGGKLSALNEASTDAHGTTIHWKSYKFPFRDRKGACMLAGMSLDVTADVTREHGLAEANRRLEMLAGTDALTGLANRRIFEAQARLQFDQATDAHTPFSLLILDVDDFKKRNDRHGHAAGDEALRKIGSLLQRFSDQGLLAARIGGEEFGMLLPSLDGEGARNVALEIRSAVADLEAGPMRITASIGVASIDPTAFSWERLLARADDAMYEAKRQGKDRVLLHEDHLSRLLAETQSKRLAKQPPGLDLKWPATNPHIMQ